MTAKKTSSIILGLQEVCLSRVRPGDEMVGMTPIMLEAPQAFHCPSALSPTIRKTWCLSMMLMVINPIVIEVYLRYMIHIIKIVLQ